MTRPRADVPLVLGIHPTARGFGWAAFSDPFTARHHGVYTAIRDKNAGTLTKAAWLIDRLKPETLVIEAFDRESSLRSERIRKICLQVINLAADRGVEVKVYKRGDVQNAFRVLEARSREEIARAVARNVPGLAKHLPQKRKDWIGEDRRLSVFCAAALVLTHYHFGAMQFFDDLRDAA